MATDIKNLPPLPAGFVLGDLPIDNSVVPPMPEGFVMGVAQEQPLQGVDAQPELSSRISEDMQGRGQEYLQAIQRIGTGETSLPELAMQGIGITIGGGFDALGEVIGEYTPDSVKEVLSTVVGAVADTPAGEFVAEKYSQGANALNELEKSDPNMAQNIKSLTNIFTFGTGNLAKASGKTPIGKSGEKLLQSSLNQKATRKADFVKDLIAPKQTAAVRKEQVGRTIEKGLLKRADVTPSPRELKIAQEVNKLQGITKKNTLQGNYNVIKDAVGKQSKGLEESLEKLGQTFDPSDFQQELSNMSKRLKDNPFLVGDAEKMAAKLAGEYNKIVAKHPSTPAGLLKARKEFDALAKDFKPKVFDAKSESAFSTAVREIRNTTHDYLDKNVKNVAIKKSLNRQHNLLSAMDNIAGKAADEGSNAIARLANNVSKAIPLKTEILGLAALGGLGAAGIISPYTIIPTVGLYGAGKFAISPQAKSVLGNLLKVSEKAILETTDKGLKEQLLFDRNMVQNMIDKSDVVEKEELPPVMEQPIEQETPTEPRAGSELLQRINEAIARKNSAKQ
jgi:hypothetical protein